MEEIKDKDSINFTEKDLSGLKDIKVLLEKGAPLLMPEFMRYQFAKIKIDYKNGLIDENQVKLAVERMGQDIQTGNWKKKKISKTEMSNIISDVEKIISEKEKPTEDSKERANEQPSEKETVIVVKETPSIMQQLKSIATAKNILIFGAVALGTYFFFKAVRR